MQPSERGDGLQGADRRCEAGPDRHREVAPGRWQESATAMLRGAMPPSEDQDRKRRDGDETTRGGCVTACRGHSTTSKGESLFGPVTARLAWADEATEE